VINVICDNALTSGFADGASAITANYVVKVCRELRLGEHFTLAPMAQTSFPAGPQQLAVDGPILRTLDRYDPAKRPVTGLSRWFRKPMIHIATTENV